MRLLTDDQKLGDKKERDIMPQDNMPLISIIVPVYKVEKYLKQCVESILAQTYRNFELILVDDGSPDTCPALCDEFAKVDPRVIVIHKTNGGLSDARNAGLDVAHGEYVGFVDSDDFIAPNMYKVMLHAAKENNADFVLCNYMRVDQCGAQIVGAEEQQYATNQTYGKNEFIHELLQPYGGYYVVAWNKLYRKSLFHDLRFPVGKQHEDEYVIHHIIGNSEVIASVQDCLYYYRQREDSIMARGFSIKSMDYGDALIDRYHFTKQKKYDEWKNVCVYRLSCELDKWKGYAMHDQSVRREYERLRKKSRFLIYEPAAWNNPNMNIRGKIFMRMEHLTPVFAQVLRKITHKKLG